MSLDIMATPVSATRWTPPDDGADHVCRRKSGKAGLFVDQRIGSGPATVKIPSISSQVITLTYRIGPSTCATANVSGVIIERSEYFASTKISWAHGRVSRQAYYQANRVAGFFGHARDCSHDSNS